jgi:hypothetical protein
MEHYAPEIPTDVVDLITRKLDERVVMNLAISCKSLNESISDIRTDWSYWRDKLEKLIRRDLHGYYNTDLAFWRRLYCTYINMPSPSVFLHYGDPEEIKLYFWIENIESDHISKDVEKTLCRAIRHYIREGKIVALRAILNTKAYYIIYQCQLLRGTIFFRYYCL